MNDLTNEGVGLMRRRALPPRRSRCAGNLGLTCWHPSRPQDTRCQRTARPCPAREAFSPCPAGCPHALAGCNSGWTTAVVHAWMAMVFRPAACNGSRPCYLRSGRLYPPLAWVATMIVVCTCGSTRSTPLRVKLWLAVGRYWSGLGLPRA